MRCLTHVLQFHRHWLSDDDNLVDNRQSVTSGLGMPESDASTLKKPDADYPLTAHANGQWCEKIKGKVRFFEDWGEAKTALQKYLDERDDLQAVRMLQRLSST